MGPAEIYNRIKERFGEEIGTFTGEAIDPFLTVKPERVLELAQFLATDAQLAFDSLMCLSAVDVPDAIMVVYHLHSMKKFHKFVLKTQVPKENPIVLSVANIWRTADWHEREAYDILGVRFEGHPDLRRILLPDDWDGHPLRKDYKAPEEYRGMKV
jgi:NADH-quinone oxidoreductase subunit C